MSNAVIFKRVYYDPSIILAHVSLIHENELSRIGAYIRHGIIFTSAEFVGAA